MIQVTPIIPRGGSGTHLWPLSRSRFPKQFLCLTGNESLFQQAAQRLAALGSEHIQVATLVIVSGEDHRLLASEQLREMGIARFIDKHSRHHHPARSQRNQPVWLESCDRPGSKLTCKQLLIKLNGLGFKCRTTVAGNFAKKKVVKYFDSEVHSVLRNADLIDQYGLFIGIHQYPLPIAFESLSMLRF